MARMEEKEEREEMGEKVVMVGEVPLALPLAYFSEILPLNPNINNLLFCVLLFS
jgi:hypothetical protein